MALSGQFFSRIVREDKPRTDYLVVNNRQIVVYSSRVELANLGEVFSVTQILLDDDGFGEAHEMKLGNHKFVFLTSMPFFFLVCSNDARSQPLLKTQIYILRQIVLAIIGPSQSQFDLFADYIQLIQIESKNLYTRIGKLIKHYTHLLLTQPSFLVQGIERPNFAKKENILSTVPLTFNNYTHAYLVAKTKILDNIDHVPSQPLPDEDLLLLLAFVDSEKADDIILIKHDLYFHDEIKNNKSFNALRNIRIYILNKPVALIIVLRPQIIKIEKTNALQLNVDQNSKIPDFLIKEDKINQQQFNQQTLFNQYIQQDQSQYYQIFKGQQFNQSDKFDYKSNIDKKQDNDEDQQTHSNSNNEKSHSINIQYFQQENSNVQQLNEAGCSLHQQQMNQNSIQQNISNISNQSHTQIVSANIEHKILTNESESKIRQVLLGNIIQPLFQNQIEHFLVKVDSDNMWSYMQSGGINGLLSFIFVNRLTNTVKSPRLTDAPSLSYYSWRHKTQSQLLQQKPSINYSREINSSILVNNDSLEDSIPSQSIISQEQDNRNPMSLSLNTNSQLQLSYPQFHSIEQPFQHSFINQEYDKYNTQLSSSQISNSLEYNQQDQVNQSKTTQNIVPLLENKKSNLFSRNTRIYSYPLNQQFSSQFNNVHYYSMTNSQFVQPPILLSNNHLKNSIRNQNVKQESQLENDFNSAFSEFDISQAIWKCVHIGQSAFSFGQSASVVGNNIFTICATFNVIKNTNRGLEFHLLKNTPILSKQEAQFEEQNKQQQQQSLRKQSKEQVYFEEGPRFPCDPHFIRKLRKRAKDDQLNGFITECYCVYDANVVNAIHAIETNKQLITQLLR